ncbi:TrkH family potassium uptake protein [Rubinisphaera margarita]|uniref:TrkH family potassium uptake protein n=1 Tax=Rubinisphaera margarita TaxID=2909586 RepID=UPI001EE7CDB3|nr:TrkH family potassium uptake protein [Rubinisphaera margarita]MCG6156503.1 TrkH family potassium uptake protein [Rubinisphaera margarita]
MQRRGFTPAELFVGSFLALILLGTLALRFLPGIYRGTPLNWIDALFTSTSAVCVTGLIVVDTATHFTFAGQAVLLALVQLGGLGMLVLTSVIITALGGRPSLRTESVTIGQRHMMPQLPARTLILNIVRFTFYIEAFGALLLYLVWAPRMGLIKAFWPAIFHSVSAFCNAGFSTNTSSLTEYQNSPLTILIISVLIIAGGLGFIAMEELQIYFRRDGRRKRLSTHTRLVLATSSVLLLGGWILFMAFEWRGVLGSMGRIDRIFNALFMSVTPRTAGFNTIDYADVTDSSNLLTMILMMIGGSPGSTAGGMKTTTFALLGLMAWSRLRSQPTATFVNRSIPNETIHRATGLFIIGTAVIIAGAFALSVVGDMLHVEQHFLARLFEVVSAFNTVGLSMGVTPHLSVPSKWVIILLMFAGRTGPLAIAAALIVRLSRQGRYRMAYEDVVVG